MIKKCAICNQEFETIKYGGARKYCFDCSPRVITNDKKEQPLLLLFVMQLKNSW